ncbi:MAG: sialidase family protein [Eubacteriales bacterium]|nr:sialidase family protein [Eubacteriales bacterium]
MKKYLSLFIALLLIASVPFSAFAQDYYQPFDKGTQGSQLYRIPAIYTLNNGSVIAAADMRYDHGADSPNNLDTLVAHSNDGYSQWEFNKINYFDDYADSITAVESASFIDSAIGQSKETGRVFIVTDAYPAEGGVGNSAKGSGYVDVDGKQFLSLCKKGETEFNFYAGEFEDGYAKVMSLKDNSETEYAIDSEFNLYSNGKPVLMKQNGSDKEIQQNVFYKDADFTILCTSYLWLRYSDDYGKTWSEPVILNPQVKTEDDGFLGVCPGRMFVTEYNGKERIIFTVYDHSEKGKEHAVTIYSDDNGESWSRGEFVKNSFAAGKTSESQIIELNDGVLRMFCRSNGDFVVSCDSTDGGVSWSRARCIEELPARGNCMLSFINISKKIDGKSVILGSFPSNPEERADGVIKVGTVENDNSINWISTYHVTDGFFAYSCLTELADGNIGCLYEDDGTHIAYKILSLDESGNLSEINSDNVEFKEKEEQGGAKAFFKKLKIKLQQLLNLF